MTPASPGSLVNLLMPLRRARRFIALRSEARRFAARAFVLAPVVEASLAWAGLAKTLRWIDAVPARDVAAPIGVAEGASLVASVYRAHLVRGVCLPQSLLQYLLHHRDGVSVKLVFGVRPDHAGETPSIAAHAWVEPALPSTPADRRARRPDLVPMPEGPRA